MSWRRVSGVTPHWILGSVALGWSTMLVLVSLGAVEVANGNPEKGAGMSQSATAAGAWAGPDAAAALPRTPLATRTAQSAPPARIFLSLPVTVLLRFGGRRGRWGCQYPSHGRRVGDLGMRVGIRVEQPIG